MRQLSGQRGIQWRRLLGLPNRRKSDRKPTQDNTVAISNKNTGKIAAHD